MRQGGVVLADLVRPVSTANDLRTREDRGVDVVSSGAMTTPLPDDAPKADPSSRRLSIEVFMVYLGEIAPNHHQKITPGSHLIDDLGFDASAFQSLGILLAERYGIGGVSTASLRSESLTVESFFRSYVLHVLGANPSAGADGRV